MPVTCPSSRPRQARFQGLNLGLEVILRRELGGMGLTPEDVRRFEAGLRLEKDPVSQALEGLSPLGGVMEFKSK